MQVDDETWAAVRLAYADRSLTLAEIAARFGVTPQRIGLRAKKEGWPRREGRTRGRAGRPSQAGAVSDARRAGPGDTVKRSVASRKGGRGLPTHGAQAALIGRLYRAISLKLEHMEERMASGDTRSAQDEERESRALATLISNFEKVTEAVAELDRERDAARAAGTGRADAERMRREIADRLERLGGGGAAGRGSGKSRS